MKITDTTPKPQRMFMIEVSEGELRDIYYVVTRAHYPNRGLGRGDGRILLGSDLIDAIAEALS